MGTASVAPDQQHRRRGHVEERADLPIESVVVADWATTRGDEILSRFFAAHVALARRRAVPVLNADERYEGMVFLDDVLAVDPAQWPTTTVGDVMRPDAPVGRPDWTIGQALAAMQGAHVDHLPVVGDDGALHGVATTVDILDLDDLLERLESRP